MSNLTEPGSSEPSRRHAAQSKEARAAAKARNKAIEAMVDALRAEIQERVEQISSETGVSTEWLETQVFQGGKLVKKQRAVNSYNAWLSRVAKERKEQGLPSMGKQTLATLSAEAAASGEWKRASTEDMESMKKDVEEQREEHFTKVTPKMVGHEIESTMRLLETEIFGLYKRAHTEYMVLTLHSDVVDTWQSRVFVSPRMEDAISQLLKQKSDVFAMKLQAYLTTGLTGALTVGKESLAVKLRAMIRKDITQTLHDILRTERNMGPTALPMMRYAYYDKLVVDYGVELTGWTEPDGICNPAEIGTVPRLQKLKNALDSGECAWVALSNEEWEGRKKVYNEQLAARVARRRLKGKANSKGKGKARATAKDMDVDEDDEDEDEDDEEHDMGISPNVPSPGPIQLPFVPAIPNAFYVSPPSFVQGSSMGVQY